ncbi:hypothetical protein MJ579_15100 [Klebsiella pneumoniae]|nr:hypothetical protein MJ579_15100 [Klebsiella pneumoniae]
MGVSVKRIVVTGWGLSARWAAAYSVWQRRCWQKVRGHPAQRAAGADIPAKWPARCRPLTAIRCTASTSLATIPAKERKKMDRFIEFALVAAREALTQVGWSPASAAEQERTADGDRHRDRRLQRDRQCGTYHR